MFRKKTIIILLGLSIGAGMAIGQNYTDAARFTQLAPTGTARFSAMAGAFGALGGDFSSLSFNPAGVAIYQGQELVFTPALHRSNNRADFNGFTSRDYQSRFGINNIGYVGSYGTGYSSGWVSWNIALGYNKLMNFNNKSVIEGRFQENSLADYFADQANLNGLDPYTSSLAYDADVIDHDSLGYFTSFPLDAQKNHVASQKGSVGEYFVSFGANYDHKFYVGATMGIQRLKFSSEMNHTETTNTYVSDTVAQSFTYREEYTTKGTGFKFKMGMIYRPVNLLRLGLSIHLPTFYSLDEEWISSINSDKIDEPYYPVDESENDLGEILYDYHLDTYSAIPALPFKGSGSIAFIYKKLGLISFDYEYVDYGTIRFRGGSDGYDYAYQNQGIEDNLAVAHNIRAGAELRLGNFSFRGGFAHYGSPYQLIDASYQLISGGFGIRGDNMYLDFAYVHRSQSYPYRLYDMPKPEDRDPVAKIDNQSGELMMTIGLRY